MNLSKFGLKVCLRAVEIHLLLHNAIYKHVRNWFNGMGLEYTVVK
jgi:hypothetical protein